MSSAFIWGACVGLMYKVGLCRAVQKPLTTGIHIFIPIYHSQHHGNILSTSFYLESDSLS